MKKILPILLSFIFVVTGVAQISVLKTEACRKASDMFRDGDRKGAMELLNDAIEKHPDLFEAYRLRGDFRATLGDIDGAIKDYKAAIAIDPTAVDAYYELAFQQRARNDNDGAIATLNSAIAHGLKSEKVYAELAAMKRDKGDIDGAIADYQNATAAAPDAPIGYLGLARMYDRKGDIVSAIAALQTFFQRFEAKGIVPIDRGIKVPNPAAATSTETSNTFMLIYKGDSPEEVDRNQEESEFAKQIRVSYYVLGDLYKKSGDLERAISSYDKGLATREHDGVGHGLRGRARLAKGDLKGAVDDFNTALKDPERSPEYDLIKGLLSLLDGRDEDADKSFASFFKRFPQAKPTVSKQIEEARALRSKRAFKD